MTRQQTKVTKIELSMKPSTRPMKALQRYTSTACKSGGLRFGTGRPTGRGYDQDQVVEAGNEPAPTATRSSTEDTQRRGS